MDVKIYVDEPLAKVLRQVAEEEDTPLVTIIEYYLSRGVKASIRKDVWAGVEKERDENIGERPF